MNRIENDDIAVAVASSYGARVVSLRDVRTGRDWMAPGGESPNVGEGATYAAAEAVGWDECFPTVAPFDATSTPWRRRLRDHGDLWGRPADVTEHTSMRLTTRQQSPLFVFSRTLELDGRMLCARYRVENRTTGELPYLWAMHALLRVGTGDRIVLRGVSKVLATYLARNGETLTLPELDWPGPSVHWPEPLDRVQSAATRQAAKLYVASMRAGAAYVGQGAEWLRIGWSEQIDSLGIWLNYGGWPGPGDVHHIALEPTNAPVDHLGQAIERNTPTLPAKSFREWTVELIVGSAPPAPE